METQFIPERKMRTVTPADATAEIEAIKMQIVTTGAHDNSELEQLDAIASAIAEGRMTPEKGIAKARALQGSRQDYH